MALDQQDEFDSLQDALDTYADNSADTIREQGGTQAHIQHGFDIYSDLEVALGLCDLWSDAAL